MIKACLYAYYVYHFEKYLKQLSILREKLVVLDLFLIIIGVL